ncbi:hypothetical protein FPV67DRAFT_1509958 [Lyophyllum atratum]|nr:hypothetical protein FPV67DRAFT_1509958 [Lyophyllum atratum]
MSLGAAKSDASPSDTIKLPGFGLPFNFIPRKSNGDGRDLFRNALHSVELRDGTVEFPITTLREFTMLQLMNQLTDKPNWHQKVFDETITSKWKAEALSNDNGHDITEKMVDWCIAELQYKATIFEKTGAVSVYNGDVVKSDTAIPELLKEALKAAIAPLENVPARDMDWHPGSDGKVLDLVHPSLFPLIYGRTRVLPDCLVGLDDCVKRSGEGVVIPIPPEDETVVPDKPLYDWSDPHISAPPFSRQFQWLPCDVDISGGEGHVKIMSYINNLHPGKHKKLYGVIEEIISHTIPLWNMTLTPLEHADHRYNRFPDVPWEYDPDLENWPDSTVGPQPEEGEDEDDLYSRREDWWYDNRIVVKPEPGAFVPPLSSYCLNFVEGSQNAAQDGHVNIWKDYADRGLQIIVKLANIHLTPEKPKYDGGSWHVEGQLNEHICASAIYYYDSENITASQLAFRQQSDTYLAATSQDTVWLQEVYGCQRSGPGVQYVGAVSTPEGRLLTWPNVLQHQVQPFQLVDRTKPGHRKILALFLVDPNITIISTANVPCQQRDWWSAAVRERNSALSALPVEIQEHIFGDVEEFPIGLEEAKELRLTLIEERKVFVVMQGEAFKQHTFSLCEH